MILIERGIKMNGNMKTECLESVGLVSERCDCADSKGASTIRRDVGNSGQVIDYECYHY